MGVFQNFKQLIRQQEVEIQQLYQDACQNIQEGCFEDAEIKLKKIQTISPKDTRWMRGFGHLFHYKNNPTLSYHWYMQAAQLNDDQAFYHLGQIEYQRHNYTLAKHYFKSSISYGNSLSLLTLGTIYLHEYELENALITLEQAVSCNHYDALIPLGQTYLLAKAYSKAEECFSKACDFDIQFASHYFARVQQYLNRLDLAKNWYLYAFHTEQNLSSLEAFGQLLCSEGNILEGENIIAIAHKLEENTSLSNEENQIFERIMGTNRNFKLNL
ncbi:hypothetical protein OZX61_06585 [Acinetobacter sp. ESL0695]|uniref:tetratricopeptide repeat protein n=1 Tax=Acinetobacter sp. ESL0695 TaxID=2983215 RepID=UPI0023F09E20|nr:hypothetical protein [Acinetobacter sp. ESL0695]WEV47963.1 hypothetical protein OZX61_06585 [Acinetobacter sp. ESL0695]